MSNKKYVWIIMLLVFLVSGCGLQLLDPDTYRCWNGRSDYQLLYRFGIPVHLYMSKTEFAAAFNKKYKQDESILKERGDYFALYYKKDVTIKERGDVVFVYYKNCQDWR